MSLALVLLVLGLGLIVAEVFFPSLGILSVLATVALVGSVVMAFRESSALGVRFLVATALLVPVTLMLAFKLFPRTPLGKRMVMSGPSAAAAPADDPRLSALVGKEGVVEADCRPAGMVRLDGRRLDVVTRGEWIGAGERVRVLEAQGNRVVVARTEARPSS